jgi:dTDP-4-dehydrorhamnose 3,5-epimerase
MTTSDTPRPVPDRPLERPLIRDVKLRPLKAIPDERGRLMEMMRSDDPEMFIRFGQSYLTTAYPGVVKAWHYHERQIDHFVVLRGMAKVVLYDIREGSETKGIINEFFLGQHNMSMLRIPCGVLHGFKCISDEEVMIINFPTEVYHYGKPDEHRLPAHDPSIPYDWARKDR